ncbi:MAG: nuclear transport factor 2 family protein [Bacteroidales bacterium]|nr:nuclear transport factor 2 family protein [Bacteroidales bacterium]
MKRTLYVIILLFAFSSCNQTSKTTPVDIHAEKEQVKLVLEKYVIANEKEDLQLVKEIWAPSPDIVVFGTNSDEKIVGWDAIQEALDKQYRSVEETYISVRDQVIQVDPTGSVAWFSEIMNYSYIYQGEALNFEGLRFTGVLQKIDGTWYIVQSHISIPGNPN